MNWLEKSKQKTEKRSPITLLYGVTGVGKTSLAVSFPNSAIVYGPGEQGIRDLIDAGKVPDDYPKFFVESWEELLDLTAWLGTEENPYKKIFFDSTSEFQRMLFDFVCRTEFNGNNSSGKGGFNSFAAGPIACVPHWEKWLTSFEPMRDRQVAPYLLGHAKVVTRNDPTVEAYDRWQPDIYESKMTSVSLLTPTEKIVSEIGFIKFDTYTEESAEQRKAGRGGRAGSLGRVLCYEHSPGYVSKSKIFKDNIALGDTPEEGFNNILQAYKTEKGIA